MPTVSGVVDRYADHLTESMYSDSHLRTVRWRLEQLVESCAARQISDITAADVARHLRSFETERGASEGYMASMVSTYKAFWTWASDQGLCANVALKIRRRSHRPQVRRPAPSEDVEAVALALPAYAARRGYNPVDLRNALLVSMSLDSGARRLALLSLRRDALAEALRSPQSSPAGPAYVAMSHSKGKTAKVRFFAETADLARRWLAMLPDSARFVFCNTRTWKRLQPDSVGRCFAQVCKFAGVPAFRSHAVRKRMVTDVAEEAGIRTAQEYAGHSSVTVTLNHYVEPFADGAQDAAAVVSARRRHRGEVEQMAQLFNVTS